MYGSCDTKWDRILSFWDIFRFFIPLPTQKIKILKNWKKKPGDIIILQMWTIKEDQMMYGSWDMVGYGQNFLSFWTIFSPLAL